MSVQKDLPRGGCLRLERVPLESHTLSIFLEGKFSLLVVILVLPSTPIFPSLCHGVSGWNKADIAKLTFPLFLGILDVAFQMMTEVLKASKGMKLRCCVNGKSARIV